MAFIKAKVAAETAAKLTANLTGGKGNVAAESAARAMEELLADANKHERRQAAILFSAGLDKEAVTNPNDREALAISWKRAAADRASKVRLIARAIMAEAVDAKDLNPVELKGQKLRDGRKTLEAYRADLGGYLKRCGITNPNDTLSTDRGITVSGWLDAFVLATRALAMEAMIAAASEAT